MENTYKDLSDCVENWNYPEEENLKLELEYREKLFKLCKKINELFNNKILLERFNNNHPQN